MAKRNNSVSDGRDLIMPDDDVVKNATVQEYKKRFIRGRVSDEIY